MANYHVVPNTDSGKWEVIKEGGQQASAVTETQSEAEKTAKELTANSGGGEVRIHGQDGKIKDSDTISPANDPFPPRDTIH